MSSWTHSLPDRLQRRGADFNTTPQKPRDRQQDLSPLLRLWDYRRHLVCLQSNGHVRQMFQQTESRWQVYHNYTFYQHQQIIKTSHTINLQRADNNNTPPVCGSRMTFSTLSHRRYFFTWRLNKAINKTYLICQKYNRRRRGRKCFWFFKKLQLINEFCPLCPENNIHVCGV